MGGKIFKRTRKAKAMREIKFRAWDKKEKKIYYGDEGEEYLISISLNEGIDEVTKVVDSKWLNRKEDDFILMQYTGLKDKNGKEIYEGDIVVWPHLDSRGYHEIYYNQEEVHYFARPLVEYNETESYLDSTHMEIIGNIYENPELKYFNRKTKLV